MHIARFSGGTDGRRAVAIINGGRADAGPVAGRRGCGGVVAAQHAVATGSGRAVGAAAAGDDAAATGATGGAGDDVHDGADEPGGAPAAAEAAGRGLEPEIAGPAGKAVAARP